MRSISYSLVSFLIIIVWLSDLEGGGGDFIIATRTTSQLYMYICIWNNKNDKYVLHR